MGDKLVGFPLAATHEFIDNLDELDSALALNRNLYDQPTIFDTYNRPNFPENAP